MAKRGPRQLSDPRSYITFDDVFALALARTKSERFVAESGKWQNALYDIWQKYKDRIPELRAMFFDESRKPLAPQSDAFYQLLNILSASRLISLPNPNFEYICMDKSQKRHARVLEERLLDKYKEYIQEIGQVLEKQLASSR